MAGQLREAYLVPGKLQALDAALAGGGRAAPPRIDHHRIFLLLYRDTTLRWIEFAERSQFPDFFDRLLVEFQLRYERYVFDVAVGKAARTAPQWSAYFSWAERYREYGDPLTRTVMVFQGAYAHTRFDLGESIASVFEAEPSLFGERQRAGIQHELLSAPTNRIFSDAAADFLSHLDTTIPWVSMSFGQRPLWLYFTRHTAPWIPRMQRWRAAAWRDAMQLLGSCA